MPISSSEILLKYSIKTGSAGNQNAQGNPNQSLGKYISTTQVPAGALNNLFDNISGSENAASAVDHRCVFVHNSNTTLTLLNVVAWISAEVPGGADCFIGADPAAASPIAQSTSQAAAIAAEGDTPAGVVFSAPTSKVEGIALGDIPPGHCKAIWIQRQATNSPAVSADGVTIRCEGDTAA